LYVLIYLFVNYR